MSEDWTVMWESEDVNGVAREHARFFSPIGRKFSCQEDVVRYVKLAAGVASTPAPAPAGGSTEGAIESLPISVATNYVTPRSGRRNRVRAALSDTPMSDATTVPATSPNADCLAESENDDAHGGADVSTGGDTRGLEPGDDNEDAGIGNMDVAVTQAQPEDDDRVDGGDHVDNHLEEPGTKAADDPTLPRRVEEDDKMEVEMEQEEEEFRPPLGANSAAATPASPGDGLTAIERERRSNIARNKEVMASLNIGPGGALGLRGEEDTATAGGSKETVEQASDPETPEQTLDLPKVLPPPVVDARPGDAAVRFLRKRLLSTARDRAPPAAQLEFCPELRGHQQHLVEILSDTINGCQNNSVLLVGARGSGKTLVLNSALKHLRDLHGDRVLPVRLSGMLHADERVGMREIAEQLCEAGEELEFSRAAGFAENVAFMREVLRVLEGGRRAVVFVLEEFDLFTLKGSSSKQTLLYSVMDLLQQTQVQAAVLGVTCRHDAAELLEKRVRSRFSHRRILLAPPVGRMRAAALVRAALALPEPQAEPATGEERGESRGAGAVAVGADEEVNKLPGPRTEDVDERTVVYPPDPGYAARFNAALDAAINARSVQQVLAHFEALECTPRAVADLALVALSRMDRSRGVIAANDIVQASTTLLQDTYVRSLSSGSVLELIMVVAMSRLHRFRQMESFNFNHVENELKTMAANDFLGDAGRAKHPVLLRAFEGLLTMGLVEARLGGGGGGGGSIPGGGGGAGATFVGGAGGLVRGRGASAAGRKQFRAIHLLLTDEEVEVAVKRHPHKPAGLTELLTHEGVRQATNC